MMKCNEMMFRKALLPVLERPFSDECRTHSPNMHCFKGGDSRTNEQPGILLLSLRYFQIEKCFVHFTGPCFTLVYDDGTNRNRTNVF